MAWEKRTVTDQNVEFPNRFKIDGVSKTIEPDFGTVVDPGTPINKMYLEPIEDFLETVATDEDLTDLADALNTHEAEYMTFKEDTENLISDIENFITDSEYQTPTISGTQIQLQKQSNTNILKFRLDEDVSGVGITISLDEGATSKPLVDIDGEPVIELEKGFVEVVENAVNFTYAPKGASLTKTNEIIFLAESIDYGSTIYSITSDDNYLYVGGATTNKVYKLNKSNLSKVAESLTYGGNIYSITSDDNYLYVGGATTNKVYKLNKSDLSKVAESIGYIGEIRSITSDDTYLYVGGSGRKVYKLNKSDLSKVAESIDYGSTIYSITSDDTYLYVGGATTAKVYKLNKFAYLYKNLKLVPIGSV